MKTKTLLIILAVLCITSCRTKRDIVYLTNVEPEVEYAYRHPDTRVHSGDKLRIVVSCKNPELAVPFNSNGGAFLKMSSTGNVESTTETRNANYRVDDNGDIEFPLLGNIHVSGLSATQVEDLIKDMIIEKNYINNPIVTMEFQNFRYTTLGEIGGGTQTAEEGHINLLQVMANAGNAVENADLKHVKVYREENGNLKMYVCDLTDKSLLTSPCYQLQQNDIVYVEPFKKKKSDAMRNYGYYTIGLSALTSVTSIIMTIMAVKGVFK